MSIRTRWEVVVEQNWSLLTNAGSWVGAMAANSVLGFFYWWLAARLFPASAVGLASAGISAMLLLGNIGMLGLGTLLLGELPRQSGKEAGLIRASFIISGTAGLVLGALFAFAAPIIAVDLAPFASSPQVILLFAAGTGLTAATLVLDQALVGMLRGALQLRRNIVFAVAKLALLILASFWSTGERGLAVYATWMAGNVVSLVVAAPALSPGRFLGPGQQWRLLRRLGRPAILHHVLNLALMAPGLVAPLIVTSMLSARSNASFYIALMVAGMVFVVPNALAMVLYTLSATDRRKLGPQLKSVLGLSLGAGLLANVVIMLGAGVMLSLFGADYAQEAQWSLRVLALGVFPLTIKLSYVTILRVESRVSIAALAMAGGSILEIAMLALGAHWAGLTGISLGWLCALGVEALFTAPRVVRVARGRPCLPQGDDE